MQLEILPEVHTEVVPEVLLEPSASRTSTGSVTRSALMGATGTSSILSSKAGQSNPAARMQEPGGSQAGLPFQELMSALNDPSQLIMSITDGYPYSAKQRLYIS